MIRRPGNAIVRLCTQSLVMFGIAASACGGATQPSESRPRVERLEQREASGPGLDGDGDGDGDGGVTARPSSECTLDAVIGFRCMDVGDEAPACAEKLDEQEARGVRSTGPSADVRAFCPPGRDLPTHELDPSLLQKLRSIGEADASDELCCYSACVPLDVAPAPVDARSPGITLCIEAPKSTSEPAATYTECPAALRDRVFHDIGVLDVELTKAERAGTSTPRLTSKASARPCCYDFPRKTQVG